MGLGLGIGADALRACKASPWWQDLRLRWCGAAPLPRELLAASPGEENISSVARFGRVMADVFRGVLFRGRLQVGLPDASVHLRLLLTDALPTDPAECRKYLLWRLADTYGIRPKDTRLAYIAFPSPLPGRRHAALCAASEAKVIQQYERALAESHLRHAALAPSALLHFNLFHRHLTAPPGAPVLLLATTEAAASTVLTVDGAPIFWRTHALAPGGAGPLPPAARRGDLLRDVTDAIRYGGDKLGVDAPARLLVAGPLAAQPGLVRWLGRQAGLPVAALDAGRLLRGVPQQLGGESVNHWGVALGAASRR